jgi:biopolymer transport protein ExbD
MSSRRRSRHMARNHKRLAKPTKLNLVALMDIFTILVLFLIVNNGDVEVLQSDSKVTLPESVSEIRPSATLVIKITETDILLADRQVETVEEALAAPDGPLEALSEALNAAAIEKQEIADADDDEGIDEDNDAGMPIIIMGDRGTPYALLKRIMATCAETDYRDIALAVNSVPVTATPEQDTSLPPSATVSENTL